MVRGRLDDFFELSARGSTLTAEIRGGVVTFIAMAYIVVLNPIILSDAADVDGNSLDFAQVSAATSLAAGVMTILFGLIARLPFAFAAGLGINSFLATTVVGSVTWPEAMGLVVINGIIIVVLAATGPAHADLRRRSDATEARDHGGDRRCSSCSSGSSTRASSARQGFRRRRWASGWAAPVPSARSRRWSSCSPCCSPASWWSGKVRGGIFIGLVAGTVVAVVVEAIWHLGSAAETPRRVEPVGADAVRLAVRPARPVSGRRVAASTASAVSACWPPSCSSSRWSSRTSSTLWAPSPGCRVRPMSPTNAATSRGCVRR